MSEPQAPANEPTQPLATAPEEKPATKRDVLEVVRDVVREFFKGKPAHEPEPAVPEPTQPAPVPVAQSADPRVEVLEKAQAQIQEQLKKAEERAAEAERIAKEERALRVKAQYLSKAEALAVPGKVEELAALLEKADATDPELGKSLLQTLESASQAIVQSGIFIERGTNQAPAPTNTDPFLAAVEAKTEELQKADPKMEHAVAYATAYKAISKEQPELAAQYVESAQNKAARRVS